MPRKAKPFDHYVLPHPGGCWYWTGAVSSTGYGTVRFEGKVRKAHHVAYLMAGGALPESGSGRQGFVVMHTCDNRLCVNPAHLKLGTQKQNVHDAQRKGRGPQWADTRPCRQRFDREEARKLREQGLTYKQIGTRLGVRDTSVHRALIKEERR